MTGIEYRGSSAVIQPHMITAIMYGEPQPKVAYSGCLDFRNEYVKILDYNVDNREYEGFSMKESISEKLSSCIKLQIQ